jgi:capsule polysaccharide export protein KpsE/RkpR
LHVFADGRSAHQQSRSVDFCSISLDNTLLQQSYEAAEALYDTTRAGTDPRQSALAFLLEAAPQASASESDQVAVPAAAS